MNELVVTDRATEWRRLKALVLDSVSSPITRRVYNLGLDEFIVWYAQAPWPGLPKATVNAWRTVLETRGLGSVSINVRITASPDGPRDLEAEFKRESTLWKHRGGGDCTDKPRGVRRGGFALRDELRKAELWTSVSLSES